MGAMDNAAFDLSDRVAIVTGGGTGVGAATAMIMAGAGANVVVASRNETNLRKVADAVKQATGRECRAIATDVTDEDQVRSLVEQTAEAFGRIDILVNNAGGVYDQLGSDLPAMESILDTPTDRWRAMIDLNLTGPFMLTREVGPIMLRQGRGSIVNVSSIVSSGLGGYGAYATSKAGLESLTRTTAAELGRHGVRVNGVALGGIRTETPMRNLARAGVDMSQWGAETNLGRAGLPEEVANTIYFLVCDASSYITGDMIWVAGGTVLTTLPADYFDRALQAT
jgi:NAD(P)-dependent dehydrogenase (short-subunit alcohol dehydrogenase family)